MSCVKSGQAAVRESHVPYLASASLAFDFSCMSAIEHELVGFSSGRTTFCGFRWLGRHEVLRIRWIVWLFPLASSRFLHPCSRRAWESKKTNLVKTLLVIHPSVLPSKKKNYQDQYGSRRLLQQSREEPEQS